MELNTWQPLCNVSSIPNEVKFINCDTRDFNISMWTDHSIDISQFYKLKQYSDAVINKDQIISFLNDLMDRTGGIGDWRHIELKSKEWLKYIWFIRIDNDNFLVMTRNCTLINMTNILNKIDWSNPYIMAE